MRRKASAPALPPEPGGDPFRNAWLGEAGFVHRTLLRHRARQVLQQPVVQRLLQHPQRNVGLDSGSPSAASSVS